MDALLVFCLYANVCVCLFVRLIHAKFQASVACSTYFAVSWQNEGLASARFGALNNFIEGRTARYRRKLVGTTLTDPMVVDNHFSFFFKGNHSIRLSQAEFYFN